MALLTIQEPGQNNENQEQEIIVGIDLGTTNSLVSIINENEEVEILFDENNQNIIPSVVAYDEAGNFLDVGQNALELKDKIQIASIKRLMGKSFDDLKNENFSFKIADEKNLRIIIGDKKIRPEEISSKILEYLRNIAIKKFQKPIKKAVITVPAYFDEAAKNATKLAANLADLEVVRLVNEPTAAALAYGLKNSSKGTYCVYDLGGGTFDVSILKMQKGVFKVLGVAGDNHLGGDDFDGEIVKKFPQISLKKARKIKEELSKSEEFQIDEKTTISKADFEKLIAKKVEKTINLTKNLINDLDLEFEQIDGVILVGGSTKTPLIRSELSKIFGEKKILTNLDPDRVVAIGAAWQAYNLSGHGKNLLLDVNALSLGIEMMGGVVDKIIPRNSTIPTSYAKEFTTYADNQTGMKLHIVQGERELAKDCRSLAEFEIKKIPPMKAGMARVLVSFKLDADGLLTVSAEEKFTKTKQEITIKPTYSLDDVQIKKMLIDSLQNSKSDIENRLLIEAATEANQDAVIIRNDLENKDNIIDEDEKKLILEKLEILEKAIIDKNSKDEIIFAQKEMAKASERLILRKVNDVLKAKVSGKKLDDLS